MVYNEEFIVLEEDEDIEVLEEEILLEGEINLLDEEVENPEQQEEKVLDEAMILSASDVDTSRSSKEIEKAKASINKAIEGGNYRAYKSSDASLVQDTVKSKGMLKTAGMTIAGTILGAGAGFGASKLAKTDAAKQAGSKVADTAKKGADAVKDVAGKVKGKFVKKEDIMIEALEYYMNASFDHIFEEDFVFDEAGKLQGIKDGAKKAGKFVADNAKKGADAVKDGAKKAGSAIKDKAETGAINAMYAGDKVKDAVSKIDKSDAIGAGAGALAGGATGAAIARKIVSSMKYKLFTLSGLTILSFYSTDKEGQAKGNSVCYAIAVATDGSKLLMKKVALKGKK